MEKSFWDARWRSQRIGFHREADNPRLTEHWHRAVEATGRPEGTLRVGVPLCGKSRDLHWLAARCAEVVGVEFVQQAAEEFFSEVEIRAERRPLGKLSEWRAQNLRILVGDFFALDPELAGRVDVIFDRAALVAVQPERRVEYLQQLQRWLAPDGVALVITMQHDTGSGPPFSIENEQALWAGHFEATQLGRHNTFEEEPHWKERCSFLYETVWLLRRG